MVVEVVIHVAIIEEVKVAVMVVEAKEVARVDVNVAEDKLSIPMHVSDAAK